VRGWAVDNVKFRVIGPYDARGPCGAGYRATFYGALE
jgi:hypothetical protein